MNPAMTDEEWGRRWPNFTQHELRCKGTGQLMMVGAFLDKLQGLRDRYGAPLTISSGYRAPAHNDLVSSTGRTGPHTTGRAVDIKIYGRDFLELLTLVLASRKFTGIGISQKGPRESRFLHIDDLEDGPHCPRPWPWTY